MSKESALDLKVHSEEELETYNKKTLVADVGLLEGTICQSQLYAPQFISPLREAAACKG